MLGFLSFKYEKSTYLLDYLFRVTDFSQIWRNMLVLGGLMKNTTKLVNILNGGFLTRNLPIHTLILNELIFVTRNYGNV